MDESPASPTNDTLLIAMMGQHAEQGVRRYIRALALHARADALNRAGINLTGQDQLALRGGVCKWAFIAWQDQPDFGWLIRGAGAHNAALRREHGQRVAAIHPTHEPVQ